MTTQLTDSIAEFNQLSRRICHASSQFEANTFRLKRDQIAWEIAKHLSLPGSHHKFDDQQWNLVLDWMDDHGLRVKHGDIV